MAYEQRNLIVGAAAVFISVADSTDAAWTTAGVDPAPDTYGVALPTAVATDSMRDTLEADADWNNVGLTQEGVEVSYEPDFGEVETDQILDASLMFKQNVTLTVNTTFAEATLENLLVVWGQDNAKLAAGVFSLSPGGLGDYPVERSVAFVGPGPRTGTDPKERVYHLWRALVTDASAHALRKNENTNFPASFRVLPDPSHPGQEYGTLTERTIT